MVMECEWCVDVSREPMVNVKRKVCKKGAKEEKKSNESGCIRMRNVEVVYKGSCVNDRQRGDGGTDDMDGGGIHKVVDRRGESFSKGVDGGVGE